MAHIVRVVFGACRKYRADPEIVRAALLGQDGLLHSLGGHADDLVGTELLPDIAGFHVALPHVDAVRVHLEGDLHVVVDDERNMVPAAEFLELYSFFQEGSVVQMLLPELYKSSSAFQCFLNLLIESLISEPGAVRHGIEEKIFLIAVLAIVLNAVHILPPYRASPRPC